MPQCGLRQSSHLQDDWPDLCQAIAEIRSVSLGVKVLPETRLRHTTKGLYNSHKPASAIALTDCTRMHNTWTNTLGACVSQAGSVGPWAVGQLQQECT